MSQPRLLMSWWCVTPTGFVPLQKRRGLTYITQKNLLCPLSLLSLPAFFPHQPITVICGAIVYLDKCQAVWKQRKWIWSDGLLSGTHQYCCQVRSCVFLDNPKIFFSLSICSSHRQLGHAKVKSGNQTRAEAWALWSLNVSLNVETAILGLSVFL